MAWYKHQMLLHSSMKTVSQCNYYMWNEQYYIPSCKHCLWIVFMKNVFFFLSVWCYFLVLNCLQVCCHRDHVNAFTLFLANQISFTWLLRVSWLVLERLSKKKKSAVVARELLSISSLWIYSRSGGKKHWWMLGLEQTVQSQTRAFQTWVMISGNRHTPEHPKSTLAHAHATWRLSVCFWEWCLRCFS